MQRYRTIELDLLEIMPPSSQALRDKFNKLLDNSNTWSAAITGFDKTTGTYEIILKGTLAPKIHARQNAA